MSNRKRDVKTDIEKMVRWDADFYAEQSDDECIVCLTEKQIYLISQIMPQLTWARTRWYGDITGLDFEAIAADLQHRIYERMTCQKLTEILEQLAQLQRTVDDYISPTEDFDIETSDVWDRYTPSALAELTVSTPTCLDADKDMWWGGVKELVNYIHGVNVDALEQLSQIGNIADQTQRLISATPLGLLPFDEVLDFAEFLIDELLEEYNATVDDQLLQTVMCDLFCIAINSNCSLSYSDILSYFASKGVGDSAGDYAYTLAQVVQFAATGTFSGDQYFYYISFLQLLSVTLQDNWFDAQNSEYYMLKLKSGFNNPDSDWELFCISCPTQYRLWQWDIVNSGMGDFAFDVQGGVTQGDLQADGAHGIVATADFEAVSIELPLQPTWEIRGIKVQVKRVNGANSPTDDALLVRFRPTANSDAGFIAPSLSGGIGNGTIENCGDFTSPDARSGFNQLFIQARVHRTDATSDIFIQRVEIHFEVDNAKENANIIEDANICV